MDFQQFPKAELHLHLDALSFDAVSRILPGTSFEEYQERFMIPAKCTDLADFLRRLSEGLHLMQTAEQLRVVTADLFEHLARENVLYAEIRFAPLQHLEGGLKPEDVVEIVDDAIARGMAATGVEARLLLCTLRHFTPQQSLATVHLVESFRGSRVVGFDLAADEAGHPIDAHVEAFRYAYEQGIPRTAHAGEARGPDSVWETLEAFRPSRLGHGVRSTEDPELVAHLKREQIHLEVCPTCNVQIEVYERYEDHPIDRLYEAGLSVGINTDSHIMTGVSLSEEYRKLHEVFGWTEAHFLRCNLEAIDAAFIPSQLKAELSQRLRRGYKKQEILR